LFILKREIYRNIVSKKFRTKKSLTREKYSNSCNGSTQSLDFDGMINSMSSSMTSERFIYHQFNQIKSTNINLFSSGLYDPFLSAKRQLEELFPPTQKIADSANSKKHSSAANTPTTASLSNSLMSKSLSINNSMNSPKTPQPVSKLGNFRRTSSLRVSNKKPKPLFSQPVKSNIQKGITDDGPISPNFVKSEDYDELPIKSPYSAIKMVERTQTPRLRTPSPASRIGTPMPSIVMREKTNNLLQRKNNFKLDIKNPNAPSDYPISKTDSLALFLKYEQDLKASAKLSEKELKDKSNKTIMAKTEDAEKDRKLPDINGKPLQRMTTSNTLNVTGIPQTNNTNNSGNQPLISVDKLNQSSLDSSYNSYNSPKLINVCDNLPINTRRESPEKTGDNKPQDGDDTSLNSTGSSKRSVRTRQVKLSKDNILFNTEPEPKPDIRSESRASNTESIFEDFDFNEFINSFNDDDQYPIFKDYKSLLSRSKNEDDNNNTTSPHKEMVENTSMNGRKMSPMKDDLLNGNRRPERQEMEIPGLDKLDNLAKLMGNPSDSDESTGNENDAMEQQTVRSKSSADSAYGR
jgi:hypothetical protein